MWELDCKESWAPKNWCFWTVVLEKTLESPLACKGSNQSILKEISPGCPLETDVEAETPILWDLMRRADSLEKTLMLGKIEGRRRRGWQRMGSLDGIQPTQWTWVWVDSGRWWWTGRPGMLRFMGSQRVGYDWATELNWVWMKTRNPSHQTSKG